MASVKLGLKSQVFHREGQTWVCKTKVPSDVVVEVGGMSFHLHKFPLLSRSGLLEKLIEDFCSEDGAKCVLELHDIPGGAKSFELVAKFCYGAKIELNGLNVVSLRCAAEYLQMEETYGEGNLIRLTEDFLNIVFGNWTDSIKALEACEEVLQHAEEAHIVSRCINSLAMKACADPSLLNLPVAAPNSVKSSRGAVLWNGIYTGHKQRSGGADWWYEDASFLSLPLFKRLIVAVEERGMQPENISRSLMFYAKRYLPGLTKQFSFKESMNHVNTGSTISSPSERDQRNLLEEIVSMLPKKKGVTSTNSLLKLLHTAIILHASESCTESLEKKVGTQLDQAAVEDLLIPNLGYVVETLYDIDCVQRILDHFIATEQAADVSSSPVVIDEEKSVDGNLPLTPITMVAKLVDGYLAEVAPDVNLKPPKFQSLAAVIPDYARALDDGIYRAIDIYLKAHPWLTDSEREQLCRLMNCQKLSLEACTHAAQNERLPLRIVVQVLFFEQLRLRTSIAGWFFVSDNAENPQGQNETLALLQNEGTSEINPAALDAEDDMRLRMAQLEKECLNIKQKIENMGKAKKRWNILSKLGFGFRKAKPSETTAPPPSPEPPEGEQ